MKASKADHLNGDGSQVEAVRVVLLEADLATGSHLHISGDLHSRMKQAFRDTSALWGRRAIVLSSRRTTLPSLAP